MAITADLVLPPQADNATTVYAQLILKNTGAAADTVAAVEFASSSPFGGVQDFGSIAGTVIAASTESVVPFAMAFAGSGTPDPLNLTEALVITTVAGTVLNPTHNTQVITVYNQLNQGELPGQPTSFTATTGSTLATLAWVAPSVTGTDLDGTVQTLTSYLAVAVPASSATAMPVMRQVASTQITFGAAGANTDTITFGTGGNAVVFTAAATGNGTTTFQSATAGSVTTAASTFTTSVNSGTQQAKFVTLFGVGAKVAATNPSAGVVILTLSVDPANAVSPGVAQTVVPAGPGVLGYTITNATATGTGTVGFVLTGLTNGVIYNVQLFALNAKGNGALSTVVAVTPA